MIRHGETAANRDKRYMGRLDEPLSAEGERQVRRLGEFCGVEQAYVSPLQRAVQTASLLFPRAQLILLPALAEMDFGCFEGRAAAELMEDEAYTAWLASGCTAPCPGGENLADFCGRVCAAFAQAARAAMAEKREQLVVVAHGGSLMAIMSRWARPARPYFEWQVKNAGGYCARLDENTWEGNPALTDYQTLTELRL